MTAQEFKLFDERIRVFINRLKTLLYENVQALDVEFCAFDPIVTFEQRKSGIYKKINSGQSWGSNYQRGWFHVTGNVPAAWKGKYVCARFDFGGEALLFDENGTPESAISLWTMWENYDFHRDRIEIAKQSEGNEKIDWWFEASAGQLFGLKLENDYGDLTPKHYGNYQAVFKEAVIGIYREDIQQLFYDFSVLHDLMKALPENSVRKARILHVLNKGIDKFKSDADSVAGIRERIKPLLESPAEASSLTAHAVGHAHIDTAWLWPLEETIRKCARSFSSQLELIDKYPGFVFGASQPQHFAFIKEHYPGLYHKIKEKVAAGRFELQGGMWVEADCNLISGESMVRQILYGKNFFMDEFEIEVDNLWLPDVFGYSAALPQILKKSGINYFVTQKISWNQFNRFPNNTFLWQGIDGSEVITHFPPEDNYNSELKPSQMIKAQDNFREKAYLDKFLVLFGIGDGGGGPTEEIIESGLRQQNLEGSPRLKFGPAAEMLHHLDAFKAELPRWVGELYLEYHRGTLTTQAYNKRMNRKMEYKLRQVEMLYSTLPFSEYLSQELDKLWKTLLINQFHDIIPGSSITPVYERSRQDYHYIDQTCDGMIDHAVKHHCDENKDYLTIFNSLSTPYNGVISLPGSWQGYQVESQNGERIEIQENNGTFVALVEILPLTTISLKRSSKKSTDEPNIKKNNLVLENDLICYQFDKNGQIISIYDKEVQKQVIKSDSPANVFNLYEDRPINWDAWDIDIFYEQQLLESAKVNQIVCVADGPLLQSLKLNFSIGKSEIEQT
ncbi:MAG: alpha-mannosidase, partial [Calditrichaeota bacterium]|nr:alpha-mannosidase [Calditrichota bacterium]